MVVVVVVVVVAVVVVEWPTCHRCRWRHPAHCPATPTCAVCSLPPCPLPVSFDLRRTRPCCCSVFQNTTYTHKLVSVSWHKKQQCIFLEESDSRSIRQAKAGRWFALVWVSGVKVSDTRESFLSKVAVESDLREKTCKNRPCSNRESFFKRRKTAKVFMTHVQDSSGKPLSTATFERKLSAVSLPLVCFRAVTHSVKNSLIQFMYAVAVCIINIRLSTIKHCFKNRSAQSTRTWIWTISNENHNRYNSN